jgi:ATP-dependent DNA helicase RecG
LKQDVFLNKILEMQTFTLAQGNQDRNPRSREGWNPVPILHSICAFANDLNNWGGGYIIVGIEDRNGRPVLPPKGIPVSKIDAIQKELLELCHRLRPNYFPIVEPVDLQDRKILIIWVPGGANRPYSAPEKVSKGSKQHLYIRRYSTTKRASLEEERELISLANNIPFDDQINHSADIPDINLTLIRSHLAEIKSAMLPELKDLSISDICRRMNIVDGGDEYLKPKNVGMRWETILLRRYLRVPSSSRLLLRCSILRTMSLPNRSKKSRARQKLSGFLTILMKL